MSKFIIIKDHVRRIKKFKLNGRSVDFKIKTVPSNEEPLQWMKAALEEIVLYATKELKPDDHVGFTFCGESFKERGAGWVGFQRADQVKVSDVWSMLQKIYQSNSESLNTETFCLTVTSVSLPTGTGNPRARKYNTFAEECAKRRGIVTINNKDTLCLARALVVAKANAKKDPDFKKIRKNTGKLQTSKAEKLMRRAGVTASERGGGVEEINKFQEHLKKYKITVYAYGGKGRDIIYEGQNSQASYNINLLYHDHHYNVITSLTAAFCCGYYCDACHVPYNNRNDHRCNKTCPCCYQAPPCEKNAAEEEITCKDCNRKFRNTSCFERHKKHGSFDKSTVCEQITRCPLCLKTVKADRQHVCDEIYCKCCNLHVPSSHLCYMQPNKGQPKIEDKLFIFFDLETRQESKFGNDYVHEPNLCVAAIRCDLCIEEKSLYFCQKCGFRTKIFKDNTVQQFLSFILTVRKKFKSVVCIAHNGQAFDHQFILKYIIEQTDLKPKLIMRGTKIVFMEVGNVKFLDSLNYFPMRLEKLPKSFELPSTSKKGYFPHLFNTEENACYIGTLPDVKYYNPDSMLCEDRKIFLNWYEEHKSDVFDMKNDIVEYCISDVDILTQACLKFRSMFLKECKVDPFTEACTIASACNLVFRRNFLKPNTIGIIPKDGYRCRDKQSQIAVQWLIWEEKLRGLNISHAANGREAVVMGTKVDGYCEETRQVFEFHGCYYHGHSCMTQQRDQPLHEDPSDTLNARLERTKLKTSRLRELGYEVIEKWECEFRRDMNENSLIRTYTETSALLKRAPLNPRDAFYGGRTGAAKMYYKAKKGEYIKYIDVCSLYPWVCKYGKYPIGHPTVFVGDDMCRQLDLQATEGLIKCQILPPQNLYHPVLPIRQNNKLLFSLCTKCSETNEDGECTHSDTERSLHGTWVIDEVVVALAKGYIIMEVFEIWKYDVEQYDPATKTGGMFTKYIDQFLLIKQQSSGWPIKCNTTEEKQQFIDYVYQKEGIEMLQKDINKNSGLRSLAKLMLNSFWGKLGQRENQPQTCIINEPRELYELLTNPSVIVNHIFPVNDNVIVVNWEHREESSDTLPTVNVALAAYTTTQARLKLYKYLEQLDDRVLYYDTDSVIYVSRDGETEPPTGSSLGDMTDELEEYGPGSYITDFTSGGPKMYAYRVFTPGTGEHRTVCKVKGIRINYEASKMVNFDVLRDMITRSDPPVYVTSQQIRRTENHDVVTRKESKIFRTNFTKRRLIGNYDSVPYGFKKARSD